MKLKLTEKNFLAIVFTAFIIICGILTLVLSPREILGGIVRGWLNSPEECSVFEKAGNSLKKFDERLNEYFVLHDASIHAYGGVQRITGRTLIDDVDESYNVVKLKNDYLCFKRDKNSDLSGLKEYLFDLKDTCNSVESELVYINVARKDTLDENLLPDRYPYLYEIDFDGIKDELIENDVAVVDFEEIISLEEIDKYSLFFKTDHHWTPNAGVWVSQVILDKMNSLYDWKIDTEILDLENYNVVTHEKSFLGSQGKRVGALYAGIDDIDVITPKFETNFTVEIEELDYHVTGNFKETMLHEESITPDNLLNKYDTAYDTYMRGNHPLVRITNNNNANGKTALIVMDSFGCVVAPFLSIGFKQLDCIDIRSYSDSVTEYITNMKPDVVIYSITSHQ